MHIIIRLKETMRYVGLTPYDSYPILLLRVLLTLSLVYINTTALWFILFDGKTFGDIARALSSLFIFADVLTVYGIFLWKRHSVFEMIQMIENQVDRRKSFEIFQFFSEKNKFWK